MLISIIFLLNACSMQETKPSRPLIVYEVFVQSFRDSNNDGIGDLPGLISKLDYIKDLGANAIWITPVHPSPSYHKYDVTDYYSIHPDYGTMEDMQHLIAEIHKRDMKLIMDLVINHTSALHPWFIQSSSSVSNPYHDYYVWKDFKTVQEEINKKSVTFDSDNITQWHPGEAHEDHYYGFFWKGMPDLNFDNPKVREEIFNIAKFWIEKGADGFRMDAARHIYPDDQIEDTRKFWEEFTHKMKSLHPELLIIGEVWAEPQLLASLLKGLPSLFNFELAKSIPDMINSAHTENFKNIYSKTIHEFDSTGLAYDHAILLNNHDMNRIRSTLRGDVPKSKLAASILLTLPGTPYIYYGEETGMLGMKPDEHIREPFLWGDENFQDTSWIKTEYSTPSTVQSVAQQVEDESSIYHYYKKWIHFRKKHPAIATGKLQFMSDHSQKEILAYSITNANEVYFVFHNISNAPVNIMIPVNSKLIFGTTAIQNDTIPLAAYSSAVTSNFNLPD